MPLVIVDRHPDRAVLGQELAQQHQPGHDHRQPLRVFEAVVVMFEGRPGVVGRVDVDALYPARVEGQERLQRLEVVPLHQQPLVAFSGTQIGHLIEQPIRHPVCRPQILFSRQPVQKRDIP